MPLCFDDIVAVLFIASIDDTTLSTIRNNLKLKNVVLGKKICKSLVSGF